MTIPNRTVSIKSVFASTANTTIPTPPAPGVSYRNTGTTAAEIGEGWPFKEVVDSAKFNQAMYEYTTICQQVEKYGFLPWSANTDYPAQGCALGSDGKIYQAKQATGPSSTSIDPTTDTSHTYWDLFYYATVTANRALVSNGSGKVSASATTATEIGYVHGVTSAIQTQLNNKANNKAVVHIAGAETITGAKTFSSTIAGSINGNAATVTNGVYTTGNQTIAGNKTLSGSSTFSGSATFQTEITQSNASPVVYLKNTGMTKGTAPSEEPVVFVRFRDSADKDMGSLRYGYGTNKESKVSLRANKANASGDTATAEIRLVYPASGNPYATAPASDVNGSIVTTVSKTKAQKGGFELGNGLIVNWGSIEDSGSNTYTTTTFSIPFTTSNYGIVLQLEKGSVNPLIIDSRDATSFTWYRYSGGVNWKITWLAIGY